MEEPNTMKCIIDTNLFLGIFQLKWTGMEISVVCYTSDLTC